MLRPGPVLGARLSFELPDLLIAIDENVARFLLGDFHRNGRLRKPLFRSRPVHLAGGGAE